MPAHQPTSVLSTLTTPADVLQPHNAKKRAVSEIPPDDEPRQPKKHRKDLEILHDDDKAVANSNSNKDSKKKRKKRKSPLTTPNIEIEPVTQAPAQSVITVVPVSVASSSTLSETSLPSPVVKSEKPAADGNALCTESLVSTVKVEEKPASTVSVKQKPAVAVTRTYGFGLDNQATDKGKGRAILVLSDNPTSLAQRSSLVAGPSRETDPLKEAQAQITELSAQLQSQKTLLSRYENNLSHLQQSLTCEICLDLLYKPFSLSPCGHVACYMCLIRWFTSIQNHGGGNNQYNVNPPAELDDIPTLLNSRAATRGAFLRNRKTCPLCRASITSRPAEVWSIKSMVANLVKSNLVDLPSAPPPSATETPDADALNNPRNDPWRNVFPKSRHQHHHQPQFYPPPPENNEGGQEWGIEHMGMYDAEDGGIYRCLDCMHEIWGGVCTNCNREYPGHARFDDDDDDDDDDYFDDDDGDGFLGGNVLGRRLREIIRGYNEPALGWGPEDDEDDDDDINLGEFYDAHDDPVELTDDESISDEGSDQGLHTADEEWTTEDDGEEEDGEPDIYHHFHGLPLSRDVGMLRGLPTFPGHHNVHGRPALVAHTEGEEDEDEDEEDDENESESESDHSHPDSEVDYEGSFIDDGEGDHGHYHDHDEDDDDDDGDGWGHHHRYGGYENEDDGPDDHNYGSMARRLGRGMRLGGVGPPPIHPVMVHSSYLPHNAHRGRRESPINIDDGEDSDNEAEADLPRAGPSSSRRARRQARRALIDIENEDEEDEEEDEMQEVRSYRCPGSGATSNRRRRLRAQLYDDDDDDESE